MPFKVKQICQVSPEDLRQALIGVFEKWGQPACIKVDNGRPLGDPTKQQISPLALWLLTHDIQVIFNRSYQPTDNAKVERMQGFSKNLAEPENCHTYEELRIKLIEACQFQRRHYPTRTLKKQTRVSVYPELDQPTGRVFDIHYCNLESVCNYLSKGKWQRLVSKVGQIYFMGKRWSVGRKYAKKWVSVQLDLDSHMWKVYSEQMVVIKSLKDTLISKEAIQKLDLWAEPD